jgi:hypothetical protein
MEAAGMGGADMEQGGGGGMSGGPGGMGGGMEGGGGKFLTQMFVNVSFLGGGKYLFKNWIFSACRTIFFKRFFGIILIKYLRWRGRLQQRRWNGRSRNDLCKFRFNQLLCQKINANNFLVHKNLTQTLIKQQI